MPPSPAQPTPSPAQSPIPAQPSPSPSLPASPSAPIPMQPAPSPIQPAPIQPPSPAQPAPSPDQPSSNPAQQFPAQPMPDPADTSYIPVIPSQKPIFFPRPIRPGSIVNLPSIPDIPSLQNILEGALDRIPGGFAPPSQAQDGAAPGFQFNPNLSDGNAIFMQNSVYNSHSEYTLELNLLLKGSVF